MPDYVFFLGSNPALSRLEIQSVLPDTCSLESASSSPPVCVAKCRNPLPDTTFDRLGGTERVGTILGVQQHAWRAQEILDTLSPLPKKWMLGLSSFDSQYALDSLAFELKSLAQENGSKLKFVLPKGSGRSLNAAQVIFNRLDAAPNVEVLLLPAPIGIMLVKTIWIQDIRAYEIRDTSRPARSGEVGMLPPKLAQIMINLAVGKPNSVTIWDPFCGMGTVIQEGQLMGHATIGSDISPEMVAATQKNLAWLAEHFDVSADPVPRVFEHDARQKAPEDLNNTIDAVVTEPNLGPPLRSPAFAKASAGRPLLHPKMKSLKTELTSLYIQAFRNFHPTLKSRGRVVFIIPGFAMQRGQDFVFLFDDMLDSIQKLGYRRLHPFGKGQRLLYARPDAWVGRELTLWEKV